MPVDRLRHAGRFGASSGVLPAGRRPICGLVVDSAESARHLLCRAGSRSAGHDSVWIEAADVPSALELLAGSEIDLIVADPHSVGCEVEVFTALSGRPGRPGPVVVVVSDDCGPGGIQQMLDAGVACFVPKYLPESILESQLRRLVAELFVVPAHSIREPGSTGASNQNLARR